MSGKLGAGMEAAGLVSLPETHEHLLMIRARFRFRFAVSLRRNCFRPPTSWALICLKPMSGDNGGRKESSFGLNGSGR